MKAEKEAEIKRAEEAKRKAEEEAMENNESIKLDQPEKGPEGIWFRNF